MPVQTRSQTMISNVKCDSTQAQALLKEMDNIKTITCVNTDLYYSKLSLMNKVIDGTTIYCENLRFVKNKTKLLTSIMNKIAYICRHIESPKYAPVTNLFFYFLRVPFYIYVSSFTYNFIKKMKL